MKKALKIIGIIFAVIMVILLLIYFFVLQYPNLKKNPKVGKWYHISGGEMKSSDGSSYRAFFKKGSENKVLIYFAGGGMSINEDTARSGEFNTKIAGIDVLANFMMNMGGLATDSDSNPLRDWTIIAFPYSTGDCHTGTNEFKYTDKDGKERILYHYGYKNYSYVMQQVMKYGGVNDPDSVIVTGYSAGAFGAAMLAEDVFTNYFPNTQSKNVLVDAALLLNDDWHSIAADVWKTPTEISDRINGNNITQDCLASLHEKYGDNVHILYDTSTRDGDMAKGQYFCDTGDGSIEATEEMGDRYQALLKEHLPELKEKTGAYLFVWDGMSWYDKPINLTAHTIIATPNVYQAFEPQGKSISEWLNDAVNGDLNDYGLDLVDKVYEKTENK